MTEGLRQKALGLAVAPLLGPLYGALSLASLGLWALKFLAQLPALAQDPGRRRRALQEGAVAYWVAYFVCSPMLGPLALLLVMHHGGLAGRVAGAAYIVYIFVLDRRPYDGSATKREITFGFMTGVLELMSEVSARPPVPPHTHRPDPSSADARPQYFAAELVVTEDLDPSRRYIVGYHPHGILSFGFVTNFRRAGPGSFGERFPFIDLRPMTLRANFYSPFCREILISMGICEVGRTTIDRVLARGSGSAVGIVVGGAAEAIDTRPGHFDLTLANRKGFVRAALKNGADLVPCLTFGENDVFDMVPPGGALDEMVRAMKAVFGATVPLFYGRGHTRVGVGLLPHRKKLTTVCGRPIRVARFEGPFQALFEGEGKAKVDALHAEYVAALKEIYDRHKAELFLDKKATFVTKT